MKTNKVGPELKEQLLACSANQLPPSFQLKKGKMMKRKRVFEKFLIGSLKLSLLHTDLFLYYCSNSSPISAARLTALSAFE